MLAHTNTLMERWLDKSIHSFIVLNLIALVAIIGGSYLGIDNGSLPAQIGLVYQIVGFVMMLGSTLHSYTVSTNEGKKISIEPISYRSLHGWGITAIISGLVIQLTYV